MRTRVHRTLLIVAGAALYAMLPLAAAHAQSLRGSPASINRMYRHARSEDFSFFQTSASVRRAVAKGYLVQLWPDANFTLHEVGYPFVRPATQTFVQRLAAQYVAACGEQLEVTSAVRPATSQPANSVEKSVHPTGMAVDLHKPTKHPKCLRWLRSTLLELEKSGIIEATEEFAPPHFHIAVYSTPYRRYVAALSSTATTTVASNDRGGSATYRVRPGDTLWDIAREHDTTVSAITSANNLDDGDAIQPGQKLIIPDGG
jgi:LysM repeat protein